LKAMRAAAGFTDGNGMFFCPRSQVIPGEILTKLIFPFADEQLDKVETAIRAKGQEQSGGAYLGSAKCFLQMLIRLRTIILQDSAAMMVEHQDRSARHPLFNSFQVFRSTEFTVSSFVLLIVD